MKNKKGISLITLIITIIILIILAGVSIYVGYNKNLKKASFMKVYNEMQEIRTAVMERNLQNRLDNIRYPFVGDELTDSAAVQINGIAYGAGYYVVESGEITSLLGVKNVSGDYVVNYTTGEVVSKNPIYLGDEALYTLDDLIRNELESEMLTKTGEYDEAKGVNKPVTTQGMLPVKYNTVYSKWVITSEKDPEWYDYSASANQWANVMLMDDIELEGMTNEQVRNSSKESLVGKLVTKEGSAFVWIPRYTYKGSGSSVEIVYSKLTSDYTGDGFVKNPAFYFGEYNGAETDTTPNSGYKGGGKELTGIWVSKYEAGYNN